MNFAFVSMEYQELGPPMKNENALVILNEENQPTHVAYNGEFKRLGWWIPNITREVRNRIIRLGVPVNRKYAPLAFAKIIGSSQQRNLHLEYESWQKGTFMTVELYSPVSVSPFEHPQQKLVFADVTVYADDLSESGGYGRKDPVRNTSALVCINAASEIIFIAQAHKFREVSPEELTVHKLPQDEKSLRYDEGDRPTKNILFDDLRRSWERITHNG